MFVLSNLPPNNFEMMLLNPKMFLNNNLALQRVVIEHQAILFWRFLLQLLELANVTCHVEEAGSAYTHIALVPGRFSG